MRVSCPTDRPRPKAIRSGILLRTFAWENNVVPRIGPPPQSVVDEQTPLCDIYVGIMSARFGGEGTRESGTEQEVRAALTRFGHDESSLIGPARNLNRHKA